MRLAHKIVNRLRRETRQAWAYAKARLFDTQPSPDDVVEAWRTPRGSLMECVDEWRRSQPVLFDEDLVSPANMPGVIEMAEHAMEGRISVYGRPHVLTRSVMWRQDPLTCQVWPEDCHFTRFRFFHPSKDGITDIRRLWEIGRFGWALPLAQSCLHRARADCGRAWSDYVLDFIDRQQPEFGPHWLNAMEAGIRAIQWCRGRAMLPACGGMRGMESSTIQNLDEKLLASFLAHGRYMRAHLEWTPYGRTNHYLADLVGLLALAVFVPQFREAGEWRRFAVHELVAEMEVQTDPDGFHSEASTAYHHFVAELYLLAAMIDRRHHLGLAPSFYQRLGQVLKVDRELRGREDIDPRMGDDDSGSLHLPAEVWLAGEKASGIAASDWGSNSVGLSHSGLYVLRSSNLSCHIACGPNGQQGVGGHAHNDKLSVVIRVRGKPLAIDSGTCCYSANLDLRDRFRSTAMHNTLRVDGLEQNALVDWRKLHDHARAQCSIWEDDAKEVIFSGYHDGFARDCIRHRRTVRLERTGGRLLILDELEGRGVHVVEFFLHLAPSLKREVMALEKNCLRLSHAEVIFPEDTPLELLETTCSPVYGEQKSNWTLYFQAKTGHQWRLPWEVRALDRGGAGQPDGMAPSG
ncbi:MAG: alginate lyase family protein [Verrucomicrobiae bacterium]|nr:alginate lyase family protein [Verrucomicrobiae bacterium]